MKTNLTTKLKNTDTETFVTFALSFENTGWRGLGQSKAEPLDGVIPAWSAGIQADMDVSGRIRAKLDAGYPCRHECAREGATSAR